MNGEETMGITIDDTSDVEVVDLLVPDPISPVLSETLPILYCWTIPDLGTY
jgi:hypothetical protein